MPQPVLVAGARTPIGRLLPSLSTLPAPALAGTAIVATLDRSGITGAVQAGAVIMGKRSASRSRPDGRPATTVNKLCLSGLTAIALAARRSWRGSTTSWWRAAWSPCRMRRTCWRAPGGACVTVRHRWWMPWTGTPIGVRVRRHLDGRGNRALPGRPGDLPRGSGRVRC
jgi:hypothetical protein